MVENYLFTLIVSLAIAIAVCQGAAPVVHTAAGVLSGSWQVSTGGRTYAAFQGVPYARPPVGEYRFQPPQKPSPWSGTLNAVNLGSACLQYDLFSDSVQGNEDCLFLNVYTPKVTSSPGLPVVVFIHGGDFMYGSGGLYSPVHIMDRDLVVVTINYRVGPLGFLSTADDVIPGNLGLKDQVLALRWIQDNIAAFGGNPKSVTLMGQSAGAASVHYHYLSPMSRGLFARGMAMSGSALAPWAQATKPAEKARALAAHIGCSTSTSQVMLNCLRSQSAQSIVAAQSIFFDWSVHLVSAFLPIVEPTTASNPFLTKPPYLAARTAASVPLLTSDVSEEGLSPAAAFQTDSSILPELEASWSKLASEILVYNDTLPASKRDAVAKKIKDKYLGGKAVSKDTFSGLVQALTDRLYLSGGGHAAQLHADIKQTVYFYRYSFRGEKSLTNLIANNNVNYGVCHGDDLVHIFQYYLKFTTAQDIQMRELLLDMVYSYASTGVPKVAGVTWTPLRAGSSSLTHIEIAGPGKVYISSTADFGQRSFWTSLGFAENENA